MKTPKRLLSLMEEGLIDEVVRPITSGKEAEVYVVWSQGALRAAKVYKEVNQRTFRQRTDYLDGRVGRSSRGERAQRKGGRFGREQEEESWQTTEVAALHRLAEAGVRVPTPRAFLDGVLIMDLVPDALGNPAPRLADCDFSADDARALFDTLIGEVRRMLCAGVVHGDLSEYNVLLSVYGPVIIDLPQMIEAAASQSARRLLLRDVANLRAFVGRFAPELLESRYAEEMWALYERALLKPDTALTGRWRPPARAANTAGVMQAIEEAEAEHMRRNRPPRDDAPKRDADKRVEDPSLGHAPSPSRGRGPVGRVVAPAAKAAATVAATAPDAPTKPPNKPATGTFRGHSGERFGPRRPGKGPRRPS